MSQQHNKGKDAVRSLIDLLLFIIRSIRYWIERLCKIINSFTNSSNIILLDNGKRIMIGKQIAEGGFSIVYEATDIDITTTTMMTIDNNITTNYGKNSMSSLLMNNKYALKKIRCPEIDILECCRKEMNVHRQVIHPNIMPLLGMSIISSSNNNSGNSNNDSGRYDINTICYMLFPYIPNSLRNEMNCRIPSLLLGKLSSIPNRPWNSEIHILQLFYQICCAVQQLHNYHYTHRDIKLDNILLITNEDSNMIEQYGIYLPILMDFGSVGPITESISSRKQILNIIDNASIHTTISYRPPELFDGGITQHHSNELDYRTVDVYSLGCVLHGIMYGLSPSECEFSRSDGRIYITECSHLSVLKGITKPLNHTTTFQWYNHHDFYDLLLEPMLNVDYIKRIKLLNIIQTLETLILQRNGIIPPINSNNSPSSSTTSSPQSGGSSTGHIYGDHCV